VGQKALQRGEIWSGIKSLARGLVEWRFFVEAVCSS